jgi:DNA-binding MarR family transcriptional regulator
MLTLYGLVRYPTYNDRQLSEKINLKMSTVTAIKNRLKRRGYYDIVRVPFMEHLGCEIMSIVFAKLNPLIPFEKKLKALKKSCMDTPECVWGVADPLNMVAVTVSKNYTDVKSNVEMVTHKLADENILEKDLYKIVHFPYEQNSFFRYFDYAPLLHHTFSIKMKEGAEPIQTSGIKRKERSLTKIEKKTLRGFVEFPNLLDNAVAKKINVTRQSVTKMKKRFEKEGILTTLKIPNIKKLGYDILLYAHPQFNPQVAIKSKAFRNKMIKAYDTSRWIFITTSDLEGILFSVAKDFRTLQKGVLQAVATYKKNDLLRSYPDLTQMSIQDMVVLKNHVYGPLLKKVFSD